MFLLIFLSLLFTGNRERRKCYFVQVLNPKLCQGKGKLLLVTFEHSLTILCVGEKAAFCILGTFSGFLSLSWFCTSCLWDFVPGVRLSFLKRREGGASLRWLLFHLSYNALHATNSGQWHWWETVAFTLEWDCSNIFVEICLMFHNLYTELFAHLCFR